MYYTQTPQMVNNMGYAQPQPMMMAQPQYQEIPQSVYYNTNAYAAPAQPQPVYMNNAPVASMPANVSQTGISRDQFRQDLANYIVTNQNNDVVARQLALEAAGPAQNFQTGLFDKMVTRAMTTCDYVWGSGRHAGNITAVYNQAIEEVYSFSWVFVINNDRNRWLNDPTIIPKHGLINQLTQASAARIDQLEQAGLFGNNAPMNVSAATTPGYQHRPVNYMAAPSPYGNNNIRGVSSNALAYNTQPQQPQQQYNKITNGAKYTSSLEPTTTVTGYVSGGNNNASTNTTTTTADNRYGTPGGVKPVEEVTSVPTNYVPPTEQQVQASTAKVQQLAQPYQQKKETKVYTTVNGSFDLEDNAQVMEMFVQAQQLEAEEVRKEGKGLKADEVRFLTRNEVKRAFRQGVKFEHPYFWPVTPSPFLFYVHAVLTSEGKVRQYVTSTKEPEKLEYDAHLDILSDLRNNPVLKKQADSLKPFDFTTQGGVVHDRWQDAPINLEINLEQAENAESEEEKETLIKKAYDQFEEEAKREDQEYHNGVLDWKLMHPEESEDGFGPSEGELPESRRVEKEKLSRSRYQVINKYLFDELLPSEFSAYRFKEALEKCTPVEENNVTVSTLSSLTPVHVTTHYKDKEVLEEKLDLFYWKDDLTTQDEEELKSRTLDEVYESLYELYHSDEVPMSVFERFNTRVTDLINESLYHIYGLETTIDSFLDDYVELVQYINGLSLEDHPNKSLAYRYMVLNVLTGINTLYRGDEDADVSATNKLVRAIMERRNVIHIDVPTTSRANGIMVTGDNFIQEKENKDLFRILFTASNELMHQRGSRKYYPKAIHGVYMSFADGRTYKVLPFLANDLDIDDMDDFESPIKAFSLKYVSAI